MAIIKHKGQRVGIFIDTQNLYHSAKNLYKAKVNFGQIVKEAVAGRNLIRAIAYVIRTESEEEKSFFDALNKSGIETKVKDIRIFAGGAKKADWDIGMAIDAIAMANKLSFDQIEYRGNGNRVITVLDLNPAPQVLVA